MRPARLSFIALVCTALTVSEAASAQSQRPGSFYVGVAFGTSSIAGNSTASPTISTSPTAPSSISINGLPFDDDDTAWTAFAGYAFTSHLGIEAGYWDFGTFTEQSGISLSPYRADLSIAEWYLAGTARYPLPNNFSVAAHVGVARAQFEMDGMLSITRIVLPGRPGLPSLPPAFAGDLEVRPFAAPEDETGWLWGVGLSWRPLRRLELGLNFSQHEVKVHKVETLTLSAKIPFQG